MPFVPICLIEESSVIEHNRIISVTKRYRLKGFATREAAENSLLGSIPIADPTYTRLIRKATNVQRESVGIPDQFVGDVTWEDFKPPEIDIETVSGSVSLITQNVKNSYRHIGSYGPGVKDPLEAGGLINVTSEGSNGVDIEFPILNFTIARNYPKGTFGLAFLAGASQFTGKPNSEPWRGFGIGEVRLIGVDGNDDTGDDYDKISFSFQASPTVFNIVIKSPYGDIVIPEKKGWQYLHVQSTEYPDEKTGLTTFVAHTAHVDEVVENVDLNQLI